MSHFYGTLNGQAGQATRSGSKSSGYRAVAASYQGAIQTWLWHDSKTGLDMAMVQFVPWQGAGGGPDSAKIGGTILYSGPINPDAGQLWAGCDAVQHLANAVKGE